LCSEAWSARTDVASTWDSNDRREKAFTRGKTNDAAHRRVGLYGPVGALRCGSVSAGPHNHKQKGDESGSGSPALAQRMQKACASTDGQAFKRMALNGVVGPE